MRRFWVVSMVYVLNFLFDSKLYNIVYVRFCKVLKILFDSKLYNIEYVQFKSFQKMFSKLCSFIEYVIKKLVIWFMFVYEEVLGG